MGYPWGGSELHAVAVTGGIPPAAGALARKALGWSTTGWPRAVLDALMSPGLSGSGDVNGPLPSASPSLADELLAGLLSLSAVTLLVLHTPGLDAGDLASTSRMDFGVWAPDSFLLRIPSFFFPSSLSSPDMPTSKSSSSESTLILTSSSSSSSLSWLLPSLNPSSLILSLLCTCP